MKIVVVANAAQEQEIASKNTHPDVELIFAKNFKDVASYDDCDAMFYLHGNYSNSDLQNFIGKPVFINSVTETLEQKKLPLNFSRLNGWPGFLQRRTWEVASNNKVIAAGIFERMNWNVVFVSDQPGLVAARVISMIINEAFFALEEEVSTIDEIDLAMKLGTNYPYGPFEWQGKIGLANIYDLLTSLSIKDKRYAVSPC